MPFRRASPPSGLIRPQRILIVVDLPAPLAPEQTVDLPSRDVEAHAGERFDLAEALAKGVDFDRVGHRRPQFTLHYRPAKRAAPAGEREALSPPLRRYRASIRLVGVQHSPLRPNR